MADALIAYLHYSAMILIAVCLVLEYRACTPGLTPDRIRFLARTDLLYLLAAILALGTGLLRLIWFGKGPGFYLYNPVLYIKLALFAAVGLISISPTLQYLRWMRALKSGEVNVVAPYQISRLRRHLQVELMLFALIPLMAVMMARGIGAQPSPD